VKGFLTIVMNLQILDYVSNCYRKLRYFLKILGIFLPNRRISVDGCKRDFVFLCSRKHHMYVVDESCVMDVVIYSNV